MRHGANGESPEVVLFCPDVTETSTINRAQSFIDEGCRVTVFGFRRGRYNADFSPPWPHVLLGATADAHYRQRLWALLQAVPVVLGEARRLRRATAFYARNIDQLVLVMAARWLLASGAPVAYEVLDVSPVLTARGPRAAALRAVERFCLRRIRLLVLSSPAFHRHYFVPVQGFRGEWILLENKLHRSVMEAAPPGASHRARDAPPAGRPWVVGYVGLIRGEATLELVARVAERLRDRVRFLFHGVLTTVRKERFAEVLRRCPNIEYLGPYVNPRDLAGIYGGLDLAWALDLEHAEHNSRWLLPCRFYEAGYFGVPCLAARDFEVGRLVDRLGVGWTFASPLEEAIVRFLETLTPDQYEERRARLRRQPLERFVADHEAAELLRRLQLLPAARNPGEGPPSAAPDVAEAAEAAGRRSL